jgi:hypothetical protein
MIRCITTLLPAGGFPAAANKDLKPSDVIMIARATSENHYTSRLLLQSASDMQAAANTLHRVQPSRYPLP